MFRGLQCLVLRWPSPSSGVVQGDLEGIRYPLVPFVLEVRESRDRVSSRTTPGTLTSAGRLFPCRLCVSTWVDFCPFQVVSALVIDLVWVPFLLGGFKELHH